MAGGLGVVLGGGGVLCAAELGVMRALAEWGVAPEVVVGTSGGGIVAGALGAGMPLEGLIVFLRGFCAFPERYGLGELGHALRDAAEASPAPGLLTLEPLLAELGRHVTARLVSEWHPGYGVVATDVAARAAVRMDATSTAAEAFTTQAALQATSAFPGLFSGVRTGTGTWLVDGGLLDNVPVDCAVGLGAARLLAVDLGGGPGAVPPRLGALEGMWRCVSVAVAAAQRPDPPIALLRLRPALPAGAWLLSFGQFDALLASGYAAATAQRTEIESLAKAGAVA